MDVGEQHHARHGKGERDRVAAGTRAQRGDSDRPGLLAQCVAVGLAASVVPYALEQVAMRRVPRARFALLLSLLPATAALVGVVTLGQVPSTTEAVGIGMVMAASALRSHVE